MTSDTRPPGGRRPPTIDLVATQLESGLAPDPEVGRQAAPATEPSDAPPTAPGDAAIHTEALPTEAARTESAPPSAPSEPAQAHPAPETAEASAPKGGAPPSAAAAAPPRRGRFGWLALIAAGIAGGAVATGVVWVAGLMADNDTSLLEAKLTGLEMRVREITAPPPAGSSDAAALDDLRERLAKLEAAGGTSSPAPLDPAVANRIAAIEGGVKALDESVGILGRRSDEAVATAREARQRADATATSLTELAQKVARPAVPLAEKSELEALANRIAAVERAAKATEAELAKRQADAATDKAVRLALVAGALNTAVERGEAYAADLAAAKALGADAKALAALEPFASTGVPTIAALARELASLAPSMLQAAGASPREGILERLQAGAERLVRIRPVEEVPGTDASAVIARLEARAAQGDLAGALAELGKLPPAARAPAEAWSKRAEARSAALDASRRLAAAALAGLSK
jgi:hypothetical protein